MFKSQLDEKYEGRPPPLSIVMAGMMSSSLAQVGPELAVSGVLVRCVLPALLA